MSWEHGVVLPPLVLPGPTIVYGPTEEPTDVRLAAVVRALEAKAGGHRVAGIAMGGCVSAIGTGRMGTFRRQAHAHTEPSERRDWICVRTRRLERLLTATGGPSRLLIHEVAHVVTRAGHDARWRSAVSRLGAPSEARRYPAR